VKNLDLNVSAPDEVSKILRNAADAFYESESELASAWGDSNAGKVWGKIAAILEKAAAQIDNAVSKYE
jgi:hypothetical protein